MFAAKGAEPHESRRQRLDLNKLEVMQKLAERVTDRLKPADAQLFAATEKGAGHAAFPRRTDLTGRTASMRKVDLPSEIEEYLSKLGTPIAEYEFKRRYFFLAYFGSAFLFVAAAFFGVFVFLGYPVFVALPGVLCAITAVNFIKAAHRHIGLKVLEYPVGVIRLQRGEMQTFLWQEIAELGVYFAPATVEKQFRLPFANRSYPAWIHDATSVTLRKSGEQEFSLNPSWFSNASQLFESIYSHTFELMWPSAIGRFQSGLAVDFGDVTLSKEGLSSCGNSPTTWKQVCKATFKIGGGKLEIRNCGALLDTLVCKVQVARIPDFHVFLAVLNEGIKCAADSTSA